MAGQRSCTNSMDASLAICAAAGLITPSCSQSPRAPIATASRAISSHSSERRKTSTRSIRSPAGSEAAAALSVGKQGRPATPSRSASGMGLIGRICQPAAASVRRTPWEGRSGRGEAPTTAMVRLSVSMRRMSASTAAGSGAPPSVASMAARSRARSCSSIGG